MYGVPFGTVETLKENICQIRAVIKVTIALSVALANFLRLRYINLYI